MNRGFTVRRKIMTDAHCHVSAGDSSVRELLIGRDFAGVHPWEAEGVEPEEYLVRLRARLAADPRLGVGEIGLDRLRDKNVSPAMRTLFERQLELAIELDRPVVLHGAKCWGQVVKKIENEKLKMKNGGRVKFLFHGFSRSDGLIPEIVKLGGFISVGPAVLNDHAVNYRELVKKIPLENLLLETDRTEANRQECPSVRAVLEKVAELRGVPSMELERVTDENAQRFDDRATLVDKNCTL